jgi:peptide/nickel transport system permease protein
MTRLLLHRGFGLLLTLFAASLVVFLVLGVLPGDPAALMLGTAARADTLAALRHQLGFDQPAWLRYLLWVRGLLHGDLGLSYTYHVPVALLIAARAAVSVPLAALAIGLSTLVAIPLGTLAASHRGHALDATLTATAQLGMAVPNFWLGFLLILAFSMQLGWLPGGGFPGWERGVVAALRALLLPALALALPQAAILARVTRSAVLETLDQDYVRTALAKGLSERAALWRHALPNALVAIVTVLGLQFGYLLAGTVIIENTFALPGLGRLLFQAVAQRDLIVVQDLVLLLAGSVVVVNFVVDLAYLWLDPRLAGEERR